MKLLTIIFTAFLISICQILSAQDEKSNNLQLEAGFDLASTYLWRGFELGDGPVIQPWAQLGYKGFSVGAWGSSNLTADFKEIDLFAKYSYNNFTLSFTDLFFPGYEGLNQNFFIFKNKKTGHVAELGLSFDGSEKIPFSVSGGILLYGLAIDPKSDDPGKLNHSAYFEIDYLGSIKDYSYTIFAGLTPTKSYFYQTDKFSFINLGVNVGKEIAVNEHFSIPTKFTLATNPEEKKIFMVVMCSF